MAEILIAEMLTSLPRQLKIYGFNIERAVMYQRIREELDKIPAENLDRSMRRAYMQLKSWYS